MPLIEMIHSSQRMIPVRAYRRLGEVESRDAGASTANQGLAHQSVDVKLKSWRAKGIITKSAVKNYSISSTPRLWAIQLARQRLPRHQLVYIASHDHIQSPELSVLATFHMVSLVSQQTPAGDGRMMPPPTPTSIADRPTLGLKRDSSHLGTDDYVHAKKPKVAFDPRVDIRIMDDAWTDKSFELVKEEVRVGVERHLAPAHVRNDDRYSALVSALGQDAFGGDAPSARLLLRYIVALEAKVSALGECGKLVMAVLDLPWLGRDETFLGTYVRFLISLASAHSKFTPAVMEKLVAYFARLPASLGRLPGETPVSREQMFARLHLVIKTLVRQIPSASGVLAKTLKFEFPNDLSTAKSYIQYQKNLLTVAEYATEIKAEIMAMMVQRLVAVDVQIQLDIEDLEEEAEETLLQRPSSRDGEVDDDSDAESTSSSEETYTEEEERVKELRLKVSKMDSTLDLLFTHYAPLVRDGSDPQLNEAYQQLIAHFVTFILPNRTRHAQFLLFHFSQTSQEHITAFADRCTEIGFRSGMLTQRLTAIAYLSSFIARGSHVAKSTVRDVFVGLCGFLERMRKDYEPTCRGPDRRTYALYYAVSQALLYIFCFRWRDLVVMSTMPEDEEETAAFDEDDLADSGDVRWVPGVKEILHKNIILSPLNPLKVCAPAVVSEFANIARRVHLMEVLTKIEENKRLRLGQAYSYYGVPGAGGLDIGRRETAWDRKTGDAHHQLEPYFPFDPYHLPKSKRWVEDDYNEWKLPRGMKRDDDDEDGYDNRSDPGSEDESDEESLPDGVEDDVPLETVSNSS